MQQMYEPWAANRGKDSEALWGFKIIEGEYAGTIISINEVGLADETSGEVALDFNFIQKPKDKTEDDLKSENFNKVMADIINDILEKAINEYKD